MNTCPTNTVVAGEVNVNIGTLHGVVTDIVNSAPEASDILKTKLLAFASELDRIKSLLPFDTANTIKDDMENLSREATKAKRPEMLRTSALNIFAPLKAAGPEIAIPAVKLLHDILALTGGTA